MLAFPLLFACSAGLIALLTRSEGVPAAWRGAGWAVFCFVALGLLHPWADAPRTKTLFTVLKYVLILGPMVAVFSRTVRRRAPDLLARAIPILLALNILDAVMVDVVAGRRPNTVAGLLLVATMSWRVDVLDRPDALGPVRIPVHWHTSRLWLIAYTVWNVAFVTGLTGKWYVHGLLLHLALPLVLAFARPERWFVLRMVALAVILPTSLVLRAAVGDDLAYRVLVYFPHPSVEPAIEVLGAAALILTGVTAAVAARRRLAISPR